MILAYVSGPWQFCAGASWATHAPLKGAYLHSESPGVLGEIPADAGDPGRGFLLGYRLIQGACRGCAHRYRNGYRSVATPRVAWPCPPETNRGRSSSVVMACRCGRTSHRPSRDHPLPGNVCVQVNPSINIGRNGRYCKVLCFTPSSYCSETTIFYHACPPVFFGNRVSIS
jgi:hypothetical protein